MRSYDNTGVCACQDDMSVRQGRMRGIWRTEMGKCSSGIDIILGIIGKVSLLEKHLCTIEKSKGFWIVFLAVMLVADIQD